MMEERITTLPSLMIIVSVRVVFGMKSVMYVSMRNLFSRRSGVSVIGG